MENKNYGDIGSIDGDLLALILTYLPLLDLIAACQVSKSWNCAVFFSLHRIKPLSWLFVYGQRRFPPYTMGATAMAYDPRSDEWIELETKSLVEHVFTVRSSHSTLLYALSPARFSFSIDPFHLKWRHVVPPKVWRVDPIVVVVGRSLIVSGGVCEFEDDRLAVELLDMETDGVWKRCESMPDFLWDSASSTWLSIAANSEKMYVTEKKSGVTCCFDPETRSWTQLLDFSPVDEGDCKLYSRVIGFANDRLIMAGITGDENSPMGIELWEVESEESPMNLKFESIGSMPMAYLDKLRVIGSDWPMASIALNAVGDMVYIHNAAKVGEIVAAEMEGGKLCKWRTLPDPDVNAMWNRSHARERLIVASSNVDFNDLKRAVKDKLSFSVG